MVPPSAEIVQGQVMVQTNSQTSPFQLIPKHSLAEGDTLRTGESGWTILELENGYQIQLNPNAEIFVKELKPRFLPGKTVFYLKSGQTLVSIGGPKHVRYPLEIVTPNAFARAMGTQFMVSAPTGLNLDSSIRVLSGTVQVGQVTHDRTVRGSQRFVRAGEETEVSRTSKDPSVRQMAAETRLELEELFQFSRKSRAILLIGMGQNRFRELLKPCAIYLRIQSSDENVSSIAVVAREIQDAVESDDQERHLAAVERLEDKIEKQSELSRAPLLLFTGAYYYYLEEYQDAARIFSDVSLKYPRSGYASLALLAEAAVQNEKLANVEKAKLLAREILSRYPESPEAAEATRF